MPNEKKINLGPVVLLILDGWGIAAASDGNAISQAAIPNFRELAVKYPATILLTAARSGIIEKKVNPAKNYLAIGTGKQKLSQANFSLFDYLDQAELKWTVITEPEKLAYGLCSINNKRKVKNGNWQIFSSKPADNYAESPAMATELITAELLKGIKSRKFDFILAILANLDLTAHSGNFPATVEAAQIIDRALNNITKTVLDNSGVLLITSSHGSAEEALDMKTELANKKDTDNPVPFIIAGKQFEGKSFGFPEAPGGDLSLVTPAGTLLDVTPTILKIMGLEMPADLDGKPLI
jgi:2,3-bisphosphoglycerate-independent phosphoglycerate mutase